MVIKGKNKLFVNSKFFQDMGNILVLNKFLTADSFKIMTTKVFRLFPIQAALLVFKAAVYTDREGSLLTNSRLLISHNPFGQSL